MNHWHPASMRKRAISWMSALVVMQRVTCAEPTIGAESQSHPNPSGSTIVLVLGAAGEKEFADQFNDWLGLWESNAQSAHLPLITIGRSETNEDAQPDKELLRTTLEQQPKDGLAALWLILVGHGTFDGQEAKFNLRGPDVTAAELAEWLKPFHRPLAIINTASASGPFLNKLSAPDRVIITATRSGSEQNFARFGGFLSEAIGDPKADLDKDGQTSLLEAYLMAARKLADFYESEGRLATEHALLDDNGDGLGTPPDWFRGIRAVKRAQDGAPPDGLRAHQWHLLPSSTESALPPEIRARRDALELSIASLRDNKTGLPEKEYYNRLEPLLLEIARLYEAADQAKSP